MTASGSGGWRTAPGAWSAWLLSAVLFAPVVSLAQSAPAMDLSRTLKGVEARYNSAQTLEVEFAYTYSFRNRKTSEKGTLFLRKPGRMRWQYAEPAGKLFVSDGNLLYSYIPEERRAEKTKFKETEDMRAPLAFLLGRLDFQRDFGEYRTATQGGPQGGDVFITALPKSDKMPYTEVSFLVTKDFAIRRLVVKGQDGSVTDFTFAGEKRNGAVGDAMFTFSAPAGVEVVDLTR